MQKQAQMYNGPDRHNSAPIADVHGTPLARAGARTRAALIACVIFALLLLAPGGNARAADCDCWPSVWLRPQQTVIAKGCPCKTAHHIFWDVSTECCNIPATVMFYPFICRECVSDDITEFPYVVDCLGSLYPGGSFFGDVLRMNTCSGGGCGNGAIGLCAQGRLTDGLDQVFPLGGSHAGDTVGALRIHALTAPATTNLATPAALQLIDNGTHELDPVYQPANPTILRQVFAPDCLVDIVTASETNYFLRYYHPADVRYGVAGLYNILPGAIPFAEYSVSRPVGGSTNDVLLVADTGACSPSTNLYSWTSISDTQAEWTLTRNTAVEERLHRTDTPASTVILERSTRFTGAPLPATSSRETWQILATGPWIRLEQVDDPSGQARTTTYGYDAQGILSFRLDPSGSWERYTRDEYGRVIGTATPFGNTPSDAPDADVRYTASDYTSVDIRDTVKDPDYMGLPRTQTEYVQGLPVSKTFHAYFKSGVNDVEIQEQAATPVAAYGDAGNLRTTRETKPYSDSDPILSERPVQVIQPDGRQVSYTYAFGTLLTNSAPASWSFDSTSGNFVRVTATYGTTASPDGIPGKTLQEVTIEDSARRALREETWLCTAPSTYTPLTWKNTTRDPLGRPTDILSSDGSHKETTWNCCAIDTETDPAGATTEYTHDALHRLQQTTRVGRTGGNYPAQADINTEYEYDAAGREISRTVTAGSLTNITSRAYDSLGRVTNEVDAAGLVTTYARDDASRIETTTLPGGATRIVTRFLDGQVASITGTAQPAQYYSYGPYDDGTQWTELHTAAPDSPAWTRSVTDFLGRPLREERPAFGGGTLATISSYNNLGQLISSSTKNQELGTTNSSVLFAYDELGNQTAAGLDLNFDGNLDYTGPDRVQGADTAYVQADGDWWRQSASWVCAAPNSAAATTTSIQRTRLTGLGGAWSSNGVSGVLSAESVTLDVLGNATVSLAVVDRANALVCNLVKTPASATPALSVSCNGLLQSRRTTTGLTSAFAYDSLGRQFAMLDPLGGTNSVGYDGAGRVAWQADTLGNGTWFDYDSAGRRVATTNALGDATYVAFDNQDHQNAAWGATYPVAQEYDDAGRMAAMYTYRGANNISSFSEISNLKSEMDRTSWLYDQPTGLLTNKVYADGKGPGYAYTTDGRLATRLWARGVTTTYAQDLSGLLTNITYQDSTPPVLLTYDRLGRPTSAIVAGVSTNLFAYDNYGSLTNESTGVAGAAPANLTRRMDTLNRPAGYELSQQGTWLAGVQYQYDNAGNFSGLASSNSLDATPVTVAYTRQNGQIVSRTVQRSSGPVLTAAWTYDPRGLITSLSNAVSNCVSSCQYSNDQLGRRTTISRSGAAYPLSFTDMYGYNSRSEVTSAHSYLGENTNENAPEYPGRAFDYAYDPIGNRTSSTVRNPDNVARTTTYTANCLNQYSQHTVPGYVVLAGTAATNATVTVNDLPVWRQDLTFLGEVPVTNTRQPVWQKMWATAVIPGQTTNDPDMVSAATGHIFVARTPEVFTHDDDGNMTSNGRFNYTWDAENRLISVETAAAAVSAGAPKIKVAMQYDHQSRRIGKTISTWTNNAWQVSETHAFVYDGWNLISETTKNQERGTTNQTLYVWGLDLSGTLQGAGGIGGLVAVTCNGNTYYPCYDANGNITDYIDTNGTVVAHREYDAFGNTIAANGPLVHEFSFWFSTKYHDRETGLYSYGRRYFAPTLERWVSRDPIGERGDRNIYGAFGNNSITHFDSLGFKTQIKGREVGSSPSRYADSGLDATIAPGEMTGGNGGTLVNTITYKYHIAKGSVVYLDCAGCLHIAQTAFNKESYIDSTVLGGTPEEPLLILPPSSVSGGLPIGPTELVPALASTIGTYFSNQFQIIGLPSFLQAVNANEGIMTALKAEVPKGLSDMTLVDIEFVACP